ncbi:MAG: response regulator [Chlorobi bacterium]|nr:response regulator [Chlorobiota bacterium]
MSSQQIRVLIVDDEPQIRRFLRASLGPQQYHLIEAATGAEALRLAASDHPNIIILDLGLPDIDGIEIISRIREWSHVPIIVLSVRGREVDKVEALDRGADDYVTKPFSIGELLARMRTALRHQLQVEVDDPVFRTGGLVVDLARRSVMVDGTEAKLTPKEYEILRNLVIHAGKVLTHQHLLREVWGPTYMGQNHYLRVFVGTLRGKIEPDPAKPRYIITEPGVGYRLRDSP